MTEDRGSTFNFEDLAGFIIINFVSRIIGIILRTVVIIAGTASLVILLAGIVATYIFWVLAPALIVLAIYYGIILIIS
jgi:hypothetical protein